MSGISQVKIEESVEQLGIMLRKQKSLLNQQKIQVLYLMKSEKMSISKIAKAIGKHRSSIHRWLESYETGGINGLLTSKPKTGRPKVIPDWAVERLKKQLQETEGFSSYKQIQQWFEGSLGLKVAYRTVHELSRYELKAKLKVVRPQSRKQDHTAVEAFKKTCQSSCN